MKRQLDTLLESYKSQMPNFEGQEATRIASAVYDVAGRSIVERQIRRLEEYAPRAMSRLRDKDLQQEAFNLTLLGFTTLSMPPFQEFSHIDRAPIQFGSYCSSRIRGFFV